MRADRLGLGRRLAGGVLGGWLLGHGAPRLRLAPPQILAQRRRPPGVFFDIIHGRMR